MKTVFTREYISQNKGCYDTTDGLSFMSKESIHIDDILSSEIPVRDKFYFLWHKCQLTSSERMEIIVFIMTHYCRNFGKDAGFDVKLFWNKFSDYINGRITISDLRKDYHYTSVTELLMRYLEGSISSGITLILYIMRTIHTKHKYPVEVAASINVDLCGLVKDLVSVQTNTPKSVQRVPVFPDKMLDRVGIDMEEFSKHYNEMLGGISLVRSTEIDEWCIVLSIPRDSAYLYLTGTDGFGFAPLVNGILPKSGVAFWNKKDCLNTAEYIKSQRAGRCPQAIGIVKAYNPYTGELI